MEILSRCRLALIVNGEHLLTRYLIIIILLLLFLPSYSARAGQLEGFLFLEHARNTLRTTLDRVSA